MAVEASLARLRSLALALPRPGCDWEQRPRFDHPAPMQSVAEFERIAGFNFPTDFVWFLSQTNAVEAMSIQNGYWLGGVEHLAMPVSRGDFPLWVQGEPAVPVATDGGGNAFLLSKQGLIWRWDRESGTVTHVAVSFDAFLERVANDWAAYVAGTAGWQFMV